MKTLWIPAIVLLLGMMLVFPANVSLHGQAIAGAAQQQEETQPREVPDEQDPDEREEVEIPPRETPEREIPPRQVPQDELPEREFPGRELPEERQPGAIPTDDSPLEELDPREGTWHTWVGPLLIAAVVVFLVLMIFRFSIWGRNHDGNGPDR